MANSLWVDRKSTVHGAGLHALIIGVSDYQFLPAPGQFPDPKHVTLGLTKVRIPSTGAFRVARWIRDAYWHPTTEIKTIRMLLSPSASEITPTVTPSESEDDLMRAALAETIPTVPRADTANVEQALLDWQADCKGHPDDIAVLYVSGHGIQWGSKDDAIVLLEDFAKTQLFLNQAIDVGRTMKGMSGDDMPQVQLYFVDACQIQPDEHAKFEDAGSPLRLRSEFGGADLRSAPIYFGACPQTAAKGRSGQGTYFAQGLVTCLGANALQGPDSHSTLPVATTHWHATVSRLLEALQDSVTAIAAIDKEKQEVVLGGRTRPAVFCASQTPPQVTVVLDVAPDEAAKASFAEVWDWSGATQLTPRTPCWKRPTTVAKLAAGIYQLKVSASAPYKPESPIRVEARPPTWTQKITVP